MDRHARCGPTRVELRRTRPTATSASTSSSTGSTPSPPSRLNGVGRRPHRQPAPHRTASTSGTLLRHGANTAGGPFAPALRRGRGRSPARRRPAEPVQRAVQLVRKMAVQLRLGLGPPPRHRRASGGPCASSAGKQPAWLAAVRRRCPHRRAGSPASARGASSTSSWSSPGRRRPGSSAGRHGAYATAPWPASPRRRSPGATSGQLAVDVADVRRWWPAGAASRPVRPRRRAGRRRPRARRVHAADRVPHGRARHPPDDDGGAFAFVVNGEPVCPWLQLDPRRLLPGTDHPRTARPPPRRGATTANANLLRVWGGGVYESTTSTTSATERGMLVWQDFPFACAAYPEELLARPRCAPRRATTSRGCMAHPSLLVWCGNNENLMGFADWGWREQLAGRLVGRRLLPRRSCPPWWPSSTPTGRTWTAARRRSTRPSTPTTTGYGAMHLWDVWNEHDYDALPSPRAAVRGRVRLPGAGDLPDAATRPRRSVALDRRRSRPRSSPEGVRRRRQARPAGSRAHFGSVPDADTGCTSPSSTRPTPSRRRRALPSAPRALRRRRSGGSSTTAGRR